MPTDLPLTCACGTFKAVIRGATAKNGNHVMCYCVDCQAAPRHLGHAERILDDQGGTDLYHTQPSRYDILEGAALLAAMRLGPKGLNRWYATCCNTPVATTPGEPKFSLVGVSLANVTLDRDALTKAIGPVILRYKPEQALSPVTEPKGKSLAFILKTLRNVARARLNGSWRKTPFFDIGTGRTVAKPTVISPAERDRAYKV